MRRANGDWFALDDDGKPRVPLFHSSHDAFMARLRNFEMLLFSPIALDDQLLSENIHVRVIDAYSVKPIDEETLFMAAEQAGNKILTVEDHWPEGGLGEAVAEAFTERDGAMPQLVKLAVQSLPGSGTALAEGPATSDVFVATIDNGLARPLLPWRLKALSSRV